MWFIGAVTAILFLIFLSFYIREPRRMINGFLFNLFICSFSAFFFYIAFSTGNILLIVLAMIPLILFVLIVTFGLFALMIGMFINARILIRKEGRRFSNYLTLFLGLGILCYMIISLIHPTRFLSPELQIISGGISFILVYFFLDVSSFLMAYFLYQFNKPKYNQDFIIVLGSGLIGDRVPPLLASRINKGIEFYHKQAAVTTPPTFIFSGGQGADELVSEAHAMQAYALDKGIPIEHTIKEDQSVNTYQNMLFSKRIMESLKGSSYNSIFTTNNFHLFRAGLYAKQAGLNSQGIGSKTAFYYWPNAMIREYIALVVMQRKRHIIFVSSILIISILFAILNYFFLSA